MLVLACRQALSRQTQAGKCQARICRALFGARLRYRASPPPILADGSQKNLKKRSQMLSGCKKNMSVCKYYSGFRSLFFCHYLFKNFFNCVYRHVNIWQDTDNICFNYDTLRHREPSLLAHWHVAPPRTVPIGAHWRMAQKTVPAGALVLFKQRVVVIEQIVKQGFQHFDVGQFACLDINLMAVVKVD